MSMCVSVCVYASVGCVLVFVSVFTEGQKAARYNLCLHFVC